jgi:hypothetical protein
MTIADVWTAPAERSAHSITQERVLKLNGALSELNKDFLAFQYAREQDDPERAAIAISKLAANLSTAAPLARLIERAAVAARSSVSTKE